MNNLKPTPPVSNDQEDWFAYIRVSSDDQRDKQTIETQRREIERTKLVPANHIYADDGVSGTVKFVDRPGSRALLQAVNEKARSGRSLGLLVNYLDRLGRDGRDTADTALDMLEQGFDALVDGGLFQGLLVGIAHRCLRLSRGSRGRAVHLCRFNLPDCRHSSL